MAEYGLIFGADGNPNLLRATRLGSDPLDLNLDSKYEASFLKYIKVYGIKLIYIATHFKGWFTTLRQLYDDASHSVFIENNGVTAEWSCNEFSSKFHSFQ